MDTTSNSNGLFTIPIAQFNLLESDSESQNENFNSSVCNFMLNIPIFWTQGIEDFKKICVKQEIRRDKKVKIIFKIEKVQKIKQEKAIEFRVRNDKNLVMFNIQKRGRKKDIFKKKIVNNEQMRFHNRNSIDNIIRKVQVHFISFIVSFLNEILLYLDIPYQFLKLDYKFKSKTNKKFVDSLKDKSIKDIISNQISDKYKGKNKLYNQNICNYIIGNNVMKAILEDNYSNLFYKIYYKSNKIIDLQEYGLNEKITLSEKVEMYQDLIKRCKNLDVNDIHSTNINNYVVNHFLSNTLI